ncbi:MAG: hypothetical protein LW832_05365 [Parachlamydia sp.]|jgi:hypothetical protein|nr:hypothetical protein [Parachlamydia sp.]
MLYISGKNETLKDLKEKEGFEGSLSEYALKFNELNKKLNFKISNSIQTVPPYTPLFPVLQPTPLNSHRLCVAQEIANYSNIERETLREMQEQQIELPALFATQNLLSEYTTHVSSIRKKLTDPIIQTPWKFWNENVNVHLTRDLIPDMIAEGAFYKANSIQKSFLFKGLNQLEKDMLTMDALQIQLHSIRNQKGAKAFIVKQNLQSQIRTLAPQIKQQILPKIQDELSKHLNANYSAEELKKMSRPSFGEKMARNGKMKTIYLDLSTRTSLNRMREIIPLFKNVGTFAGKSSICISWASLGYDCLDAVLAKDLEQSIRIATSGAVGIWTGTFVTAYIIGIAGTTFLVSTPFGWAIVIIGANVIGKTLGDQSTLAADSMLCRIINYLDKHPEISETAKQYGNYFYTGFEKIGLSLFEE